MWLWYWYQNRIKKYYHHDGEQSTLYQKVLHIKTHRLKKEDCFSICIAINSNLLDKSCTQDKVKCYIQHKESCLRWIIIEQVNYKEHYYLLLFPEINFARTLSKSLHKNRDAFLETED